ncbi:MAG: ATP synthase F1 subunit epsilon, partial [Acetatifactor sp.]
MNTFQVYILAADCVFYEGPCESLIVPTLQGQYGILPNHSNMIGAVIPGTLIYKLPEEPERQAAVSAGLVKVENNEVLVLVDSAERPEDIDEKRAKRAADEAKEAIL